MDNECAVASLIGAYVADAATLGLHWIYDPERIAEITARAGRAAFIPIDPAHYEGVPAYFAHGARQDGMLSQYGECLRIAVDGMNDTGGVFDNAVQETAFAAHFGMGGNYVGYIDRPTRAAVLNIMDGKSPAGSDDDQLPAVTRLPAVVAALHGQAELARGVDDAIALTNVNDTAFIYGRMFAGLLADVLSGASLHVALRQAVQTMEGAEGAALLAALETDENDSTAYGAITDRACHLPQGMPLAFHILARSDDFAEAVTRNIAAGGDSCGRALVIGSVMGAAQGIQAIPREWAQKTAGYDGMFRAARRLAQN